MFRGTWARLGLAVLLAAAGWATRAGADNVAMVETMKFLAPETVNMLVQRAKNGGSGGLQVGDVVKYIIKYRPAANGGNTGANGYITDYVPYGLQVIGAAFVQPDGFGGYVEVPPPPAGDMSNDPACNGRRFCVSARPTLPATPANTAGVGTLAQLYADTGIWYSTDPRNYLIPGTVPPTPRNLWDQQQIQYARGVAGGGCRFKGAAGPWGTGSPVAGPDTFYPNEINPLTCLAGPVGPWHRIAYPGSRIGTYGLMGDLQASRVLQPGDPHYGRDLATNPLPVSSAATPVTIRWANGLNSVGETKYVSITARIVQMPPGGAIVNESEVWGGDVYYWEGGKDNPWKYNKTLVSIGNNSSLAVVKTASTQSAATGDVVSFQLTVLNTGALPQSNVRVVDFINASAVPGKNPPRYVANMVTYNMDATGGALYCLGAGPGVTDPVTPAGTCDAAASEYLEWTIPLLNPGQSRTFTYSVTANGDPAGKVNTATDVVHASSNTVLPPNYAVASANFDIGVFPILAQTKTVTPSGVLPGGTVRYHVQITNTGGGSAGVYRFGPPPGTIAYPVDLAGLPIPTTIQDTLPAGFSYAGNAQITINGAPALNWTVSALGNTVTFTIPHTAAEVATNGNEIPPGGVLDLYFDAAVAAGTPPGTYTNTVYSQVPYNKKPRNKAPKPKDWSRKPLQTTGAAPVTVGAIQLSKAASPSTVTNDGGASTTYTITLANLGATPATLNGLVVTDTLPAGFSYRAGSTGGTAGAPAPTVSGQTVTWTFTAPLVIPAGGAKTITFTADIASSVLPGRYWNDVAATATNATIPPATHTAPVVVTVPGLSVTKSVDRPYIVWRGDGVAAPPYPSDTVHYTITVRNSGAGFGTVDVSDQLPAGFFFPPAGVETVTLTVGGTPRVLARNVDYYTFPGSAGPLPPAGTRTPVWGTFTIPPRQGAQDSVLTITFPVRIDMAATPAAGTSAVTAPGTYTNQVTLAGANVPPPFAGAPVTVYRPVSKWTTTPNVVAGGVIDYYVQVHNRDAYAWSGISLVDYLGALAPAPTPSGAAFGAGNQAWYAVGPTQPAGAPGADPAWLPIAPTVAGAALTFTPPAATTIPAGQSLWLAFTATAPAAVPVPPVIHNSIQSLTYTRAGALAPTTVTNVWDGGAPANTAEDVTVSAVPTVALSATKTATPAALYLYGAAAPSALTYTITLTNPDPATAAAGVRITDTLPPGFSFGAGDTCTLAINGTPAATPPTCTYTPPAVPGGSGTLAIALGAANPIPAGGTATVTFTVSVAAATAANTYYNSFTVGPDPAVAGANVQAASFGPTAPVEIDPVHVTKQALTPAGVAGGTVRYRITVTNRGGQPLAGFSLTDAFYATPGVASGFTYGADLAVKLNGTPLVPGTDYTPPAAGSAAPTWTFNVPIPAGTVTAPATLTLDFYAQVPPTTLPGTYHDSVTRMAFTVGGTPVTAPTPYDGTLPQNTADDVTVSQVGISKQVVSPYQTVTVDPVLGGVTKYLITVSNPSATPATVSVEDVLPAGFTAGGAWFAIGATAPAVQPPAAPWTATTPKVAAPWAPGHPLLDNAGAGFTIPAGQNLYLRLDANIAAGTPPGSYTNQAHARIGAVRVASTSGAPVTVSAPRLFLTKTTTTPNIGKDAYGNYTPAHFVVTITNTGNADATGIVLTDTLPAGFTVNTPPVVKRTVGGTMTTLTHGVDYGYTFAAGTLTVNTIPPGGFVLPAASGQPSILTIEYDAAIAPATVAGAYTNSASITSTNAGAHGPVTATVNLHDVSLSKTTGTPTVAPGGTVTYTITVSNHGALALTNVVVSDYLPTGFSYVAGSTTGTGWAAVEPNLVNGPALPIWTIPSLPAASTATITFQAKVAATVTPGTYRNSVTASANAGAVPFPNPGPTAPVTVHAPQPALSVLKTVALVSDPVQGATNPFAIPGSVVEYVITVTNSGDGSPDADSVVIVDPVPAGVDLVLSDIAGPGSGPVRFVDGAQPSGLSYTFTNLADAADDLDFSNTAGPGYNWAYTPTPNASGVDPNVRAVRIHLRGTMAPKTGAVAPGFQLHLRMRVR